MRFISVHYSLVLIIAALCTLGIFPIGAMAYLTTWEFKGTVTISEGGLADKVPVGSPFRVVVGFDTSDFYSTRNSTNDPVTNAPRPGVRYEYFEPNSLSLQMAIYAGECNPCIQTSIPTNNGMYVRDDFTNSASAGQDGYSFFMDPSEENDGYAFSLLMRDFADAFDPDPPIVDVSGSPLPVDPDPRMVDMAESVFQVFTRVDEFPQNDGDFLEADIDFVGVPTYGTYYFLSGRHCAYPDLFPNSQVYGDDCVNANGSPNKALVTDIGGGAGQGGFSKTITHTFATPDLSDAPETRDELGTVFGEVVFGGPGGLPVLRGSSFPTELGRTNANVLAYQEYVFGGDAPTPLQLIVDLGYAIHSNWEVGSETKPSGEIEIGLRPGGASMTTTLAIVDASLVPPSAMNALRDFNSLVCGNEGAQQLPNGDPWPAGSILGVATFGSNEYDGGKQQGAESVQLQVLACNGVDVPTVPVLMQPGDGFYLSASIQTPARGTWAQAGKLVPDANGFVDAANTLRVIPDPAAPPEVLQQLVAGLEPVCTDCEFEPEFVIDVKPGSIVNTIKTSDKGSIEVALLGSEQFNPADVGMDSLRLGTLAVRTSSKGKRSCSMSDVNGDGITDMLCGFQNQASNWQLGQTIATLTGELLNGETILASDSVRIVR